MDKEMSVLEEIQYNETQIIRDLQGKPNNIESFSIKIVASNDYSSKDINELRNRLNLTQSQLALILEVSPRTVESWEQNRSKPNGSSRRLMDLITKDPTIVDEIIKIEAGN